MSTINLVSPWINYYREVEALFKDDSSVRVLYDDEAKELKLFVDDSEKAIAMADLMPTEVEFGNVTLSISIIPANALYARDIGTTVEERFRKVFSGNPILEDIQTVYGVFTNPITYVVFRKEVVQYFDDDLGDINGVESTLWQEIAKDVFTEVSGVYFCTSIDDPALIFTSNGKVTISNTGRML